MPSNVFLFRDPSRERRVTSTELQELFEFRLNHPGTYLVLAQGHAFADNAALTLRLELSEGGSDEVEIDFDNHPAGSRSAGFSLTAGTTITVPSDDVFTNVVHLGAKTTNAESTAGVGGIRILALTVDNVSKELLGVNNGAYSTR